MYNPIYNQLYLVNGHNCINSVKKKQVLSVSSTSPPGTAPGTPICGLVSGEVPAALENPPGGAPGGAMGEGFSPSTGDLFFKHVELDI